MNTVKLLCGRFVTPLVAAVLLGLSAATALQQQDQNQGQDQGQKQDQSQKEADKSVRPTQAPATQRPEVKITPR